MPINGVVRIRFSEALDRTTVNDSTLVVSSGGVPLAGSFGFEQEVRVVRWAAAGFYPFEANSLYEIRVTTGVTDTAGNPLAAEFTSGFTTGNSSDTTAPGVASVVPAHGTQNVATSATVEVSFSEPIDFISAHSATFWLALDSSFGPVVSGSYSLSADGRKLTFRPDSSLFAGHAYYLRLANLEDLAGNRLSSQTYYFQTGYAPGTNLNSLPTSATASANPTRLFADGSSTAVIEISNINRNGTLVPNGTKVAVTADPTAFGSSSAGGAILGGVVSSADSRFHIFTTIGGKVTLTYRSANLAELAPGSVRYAYLQVASVDEAETPASLIATAQVALFRGYNATLEANPTSLLANGTSYSEVEVRLYDVHSQPLPAGVRVGITAEPVYRGDSLGGSIQGGQLAPDSRFKLFSAAVGGIVRFNYVAPALAASQNGSGWIQVVEVDDAGQVVGLMGSRQIRAC